MTTPFNTPDNSDDEQISDDDYDQCVCYWSDCENEPDFMCPLCLSVFCTKHSCVWEHHCPEFQDMINKEDEEYYKNNPDYDDCNGFK